MFDERPIGDLIANQVGGGTPSRQVPSYWNGSIPWASVKDFTNSDSVISSTQESITLQGLNASASNLIPAGTPMICTRMAVGRSAIAPMDVAINQDVRALQPSNGTSRDYLLRLLQFVRPHAEAVAVGSTVKGIRVQDFLSIPVPIAPNEEQSSIAGILTTIDITIRQTEVLIEKLKLVKQGLLNDLLTRGIDANGELRPPHSQAPHLYKDSPQGWIPNEWRVCSIEQIAESIVDGPFGSNLKTEHYVELPGVRVVRLQNIGIGEYNDTERAYVSTEKAADLGRNEVLPGDVLIASLGDESYPVGRACSYPMWLPKAINKADCFRLRPEKNRAIGEFLVHCLNGSGVRRQTRSFEQGVTLQRINIGNLRKIQLLLPSISEQILSCEKLAAIQHDLAANMIFLVKSRQQKSGLMNDLLTGRVRVTPLLDKVSASNDSTPAIT